MVYRKKKIVCAFAVVVSFIGFCFAQSVEPTSGNQAINRSGSNITQTLSWDKVEYAARYEIVVERQVNDVSWEVYETYTSDKNEIEISLPVGSYRYSIIVYNLLNRKESPSEWFDFNVYQALQPRVLKVMPDEIYLNNSTDGIIVVVAENVVYNTIFTLKQTDGTVLYGAIVHTDGDSTVLDFDEHRLIEGEYILSVTNPGGLQDASQVLTVKKERTFDILFSGGYTATSLLPGGTIVNQLTSAFLPLGFNFQLDYVPFKKSFGDIGFGISVYTLFLQQPIEGYSISGRVFPVSIHALYRRPLIDEKLFVNAYAGAGLTFLSNLYIHENGVAQKEPLDAIGISPMAGASLQFFMGRMLYVDLAIDYYCSIFIQDTVLQKLLPSLSIGLKF